MGARNLWTSLGNPERRPEFPGRHSANPEWGREIARRHSVNPEWRPEVSGPPWEIPNGGQDLLAAILQIPNGGQKFLGLPGKSRMAAGISSGTPGKCIGAAKNLRTRLGKSKMALEKNGAPFCIPWTRLPPPPVAFAICNAHLEKDLARF